MPKNVMNRELAIHVANVWGIESQLDIAIEELAELIIELASRRDHTSILRRALSIQTLTKHIRFNDHSEGKMVDVNYDVEHLAEEIADVHLMIGQLINLFDIEKQTELWEYSKVERLVKRTDEEENERKK